MWQWYLRLLMWVSAALLGLNLVGLAVALVAWLTL